MDISYEEINPEAKNSSSTHDGVVAGSSFLLRETLIRCLQPSINFTQRNSISDVDNEFKNGPSFKIVILILENKSNVDCELRVLERIHHNNFTKSLVLTSNMSSEFIQNALQSGVSAFSNYDVSVQTIQKIIDFMLIDDSFNLIMQSPIILSNVFSVDLQSDALDEKRKLFQLTYKNFTSREKETIKFIIGGYSNKAIALRIDVSEATIKAYIKSLLSKSNMKNRTQLAVWAAAHKSEF